MCNCLSWFVVLLVAVGRTVVSLVVLMLFVCVVTCRHLTTDTVVTFLCIRHHLLRFAHPSSISLTSNSVARKYV